MAERAPWLRMLAPAARFVLQCGAEARLAAGAAFGVALPETPCRAQARDSRAALWLGPDEHLLIAPVAELHAIAAAIDKSLAGIAHSLVDVSQRQLAIEVSGRDAAAILNCGCPLDLDAGAFPAGACTRTLFGKADIVLWRTGGEEFRLEVPRSFAPYVSELLREAARDFLA